MMNERLFLSKFVQVEDPEACWPWLGHITPYGYTLCVNPAHLEPVTQSENTRRGNTITISISGEPVLHAV